MGINVCLNRWLKVDSKENGGKKSFDVGLKQQHHLPKYEFVVLNHE